MDLYSIILKLFKLFYCTFSLTKIFPGDCHTTNDKNHNNILEYSSHLPSEYDHHACLFLIGGTSTSLHWFFRS